MSTETISHLCLISETMCTIKIPIFSLLSLNCLVGQTEKRDVTHFLNWWRSMRKKCEKKYLRNRGGKIFPSKNQSAKISLTFYSLDSNKMTWQKCPLGKRPCWRLDWLIRFIQISEDKCYLTIIQVVVLIKARVLLLEMRSYMSWVFSLKDN